MKEYRIAVAGGRDHRLTEKERVFLRETLVSLEATEVVTGGCRGVDRDAEALAESMGIPVTTIPADWDKSGRAAGPIRNKQIARQTHALVVFPGGAGTASMEKEASMAGLLIVKPK